MECLKYVQRLRKSTNRKLLASPTGTDEGKPDKKKKKKRGRKKKDVQDKVIDVELDPFSPGESPEILPPSPAIFSVLFAYGSLLYENMVVYVELLAQHIVRVIVFLRSGMPLLVAEP